MDKGKILIVEDSEEFRMQLAQSLQDAGYEVVAAANGDEGFERAKGHEDINCVITDFNMPGMNGLELVQKIRSMDSYEKIPIAMLTKEASSTLKKQGKEAGVTMWYVKPLDIKTLIEIIGKVLTTA